MWWLQRHGGRSPSAPETTPLPGPADSPCSEFWWFSLSSTLLSSSYTSRRQVLPAVCHPDDEVDQHPDEGRGRAAWESWVWERAGDSDVPRAAGAQAAGRRPRSALGPGKPGQDRGWSVGLDILFPLLRKAAPKRDGWPTEVALCGRWRCLLGSGEGSVSCAKVVHKAVRRPGAAARLHGSSVDLCRPPGCGH